MLTRIGHCEWLWDGTVAESVAPSQQWVLPAMQVHGPPLVSMLWRILGNEQDVCDAYQNTFLQLAYYKSGRKPKNVKAYLFRTASNAAITILRRKKLHEKACREVTKRPGVQHHLCGAHDLDAGDLREQLRCCIARLPDHLQRVVLLRDLAELSYAQVAKILGISSASARVYRRRAIRILAVWMSDRDNLDE